MRIPVLSLLGALACGLAVMAQTPPVVKSPPPSDLGDPMFGMPGQSAKAPKAGSLEEAIAAALKQHPDVKLAEAKRLVAEAELEQAKMLVAQKVSSLFSKVQLAKLKVEVATKEFERVKVLHETGTAASGALTAAEGAMRTSKADLDAATAELDAAKGTAPKLATNLLANTLSYTNVPGAGMLTRPAIPAGTASDKLRTLVEKKIKLDLKPQVLAEGIDALLKASGESGLTIRIPDVGKKDILAHPPLVGPLVGEQTFAAWMQLMLDDFSNPDKQSGHLLPGTAGRYEAYIRDYGLLVTMVKDAPPGAITLAEFALHRVEKKPVTSTTEPKK